uniref:P2X purinoreceptor 7 intracellular domain-containing protein n=1 Tax=Magallana gigas TaxID=29159 RepID=A0A8W8MMK5_MAGGI
MDDEVSRSSMSDRESSSSPERPSRGRARGRARARSRARGQGPARRRGARARGICRGPNRHETLRQRVIDRNLQLRNRVAEMTEDALRELVMSVCERDPSLILDIVDRASQAEAAQGGYHPLPGSNSPNWCVCSKCREMPTEEERVCCRQTPSNCLSTLPDFDLIVLDPLVLMVARRYRQDVLAAGEDDDFNRSNRHAGYRQFILWQHGHLGAGNRRVIPSCCTWRIRDTYPDSFGQYRGFVGGRLG